MTFQLICLAFCKEKQLVVCIGGVCLKSTRLGYYSILGFQEQTPQAEAHHNRHMPSFKMIFLAPSSISLHTVVHHTQMLSCLSLSSLKSNPPQKTPPLPLLTPKEALHLLTTHGPKSLHHTKQIHARIVRSGLAADPTLLPSLLRLYSSHRRLLLASAAFSLLPDPPSVFAWNLLIRAHTTNSSPLPALPLFTRMLRSAARPDKFTLTFVTSALSALPQFSKLGRAVHGFAIKTGLCNDLHFQNTLLRFYFACGSADCGRRVFDKMRFRSVVSWTALLSGLLECGELEEARLLFEKMPMKNVVSWTAMIDGCARNGRPDEAFELFRRMLEENVRPNEFTLVALLIACSELGSLSLGRSVHEFAHENGGLQRGVYVGTALIDMYSKCGSLEDAVRVFDQMPVRSLATWNSMITSLGVHGRGREAVVLFREMEKQNVRPDEITLVGVLCACVREEMVEDGLRFFRYMSDKYKILPSSEHYRCLVELFDCAEMEMIKDLVMELNSTEQKVLITSCREHGNLRLEEVIGSCIRESDSFGSSVGKEVECFQWEVG